MCDANVNAYVSQLEFWYLVFCAIASVICVDVPRRRVVRRAARGVLGGVCVFCCSRLCVSLFFADP